MSRDQLPRLGKILVERGYLILPLIAIIWILGAGFTYSIAPLVGILCAVLGGYAKTFVDLLLARKQGKTAKEVLKASNAMRPKDYLDALEGGARSILGVALACGAAGIIAGMITLTGIGLKMGAGLTQLAGGSIYLLLIFTMLASIVLGMGVPTTANYLITSTIMAPVVARALMGTPGLESVYANLAAIGAGYELLPAHLFTFYFGIIADITPPVALAAMAGAAIAKSDPLKTGVEASRLAIAAFLVPYMFVFAPEMLMLNSKWYEVLQIIVTALGGMFGVGMALERFWSSKLNWIQTIMSLAGGLMLIKPGLTTDLIGFVLIALVLVWQRFQKNAAKKEPVQA